MQAFQIGIFENMKHITLIKIKNIVTLAGAINNYG